MAAVCHSTSKGRGKHFQGSFSKISVNFLCIMKAETLLVLPKAVDFRFTAISLVSNRLFTIMSSVFDWVEYTNNSNSTSSNSKKTTKRNMTHPFHQAGSTDFLRHNVSRDYLLIHFREFQSIHSLF